MVKVRKVVVKKKVEKKKKRGRIADRIVPISEWEGKDIKINIYGKNGTGKTTLACTFPKPLLLVGFEDGTKSVKKVKGVSFALVQAVKKHPKAWGLDELDKLAEQAGNDFATVVLDTVTSGQDVVLTDILRLDQIPVQSGWGTVSREHYYRRSERTREFMRLFLSLPINVVALAQEKNHNDKEEVSGDSEMLSPFIASSLGKTTCGWLHDACDYVCQTFIREQTRDKNHKIGKKKITIQVKTGKIEYCLRVGVHPMYACRLHVDRGTEVPDCLIDPSYQKILELIES